MKTLKSNFGLCVISIVSLLCLNFWMSDLEFKDDKNRECSPNNVLQSGGDILGFYTDLFSMNPQSVDVVSFPKMNPTTTISVTGQTINFNPSSVILPTNTSSFNPITQDLVCLISREGLMLEYNDILPSSSIHSPPVPSPTSAPQFFNNSLYGIAIPNNSGSTVVNFEIVSDLQSNYPVGIAPGNFAPSSGYLFNHEQISSSTNGTNEIYFVSGTNFIIFDNSNPLNPSTNWIDLGPSNDYAYYGLEYKSQGKHLALRYNINTLTIELVEITIIGGALISINQLYDLQAKLVPSPAGWILNREFYSTTLDTCDMKYYLSTLFDPNGSSRLIAIDLMKNTHDEQHNSKYLFGIEWKGLPCDKCKCGTYSDINYRPFQGAPNQNAECGDTLIAQCNGNNPWTMNGNFLCSGNMCPSSTQMTWILTKPNTSVISNTITSNPGFNISIPANEFDQSGSYQLSIQAVCDQDTCVCDFNINVECDPCCTDFDDFCERIESAVTISIDNDSCKVKLMLDSLDCNNYLEYIDWGDSTFDNGPIPPNGMAMHVYPASGTYIISYLAIELDDDGFICFEKIVNDTITLNCITCDCPGNSVNLVTNGDFSSGKTGFTSDLPCNSNCGHGSYSIGTNFKTKCSGWPNVPDHTGGTPGNLMIIDGDPNNYPIVWSQQVNVTPGETYCFSYWTASVYCESQQDFILTSTIGTETIGQSIIKEKCQAGIFPQWINHSFNWTNTSNLSGLQNLQIIQSTGSFGVDYSDFGLDDICFAASTPPDSCCTDFDAFCERIESAVTISIDNDSCKVKLTLDSLDCNNYLEYIDWGDSTFD
ncbi:MAG: hypothetical protein HKO66_12420, partial [Saprospiraceae bacterium]|nr:hypothetical protein [Saprospiraceae bacterium]